MRVTGVGNENFRTVQNIRIAVFDRGGLLTRGIGSGVGFGQTESPEPFTRKEFRQETGFLFGRSEFDDGSNAQGHTAG